MLFPTFAPFPLYLLTIDYCPSNHLYAADFLFFVSGRRKSSKNERGSFLLPSPVCKNIVTLFSVKKQGLNTICTCKRSVFLILCYQGEVSLNTERLFDLLCSKTLSGMPIYGGKCPDRSSRTVLRDESAVSFFSAPPHVKGMTQSGPKTRSFCSIHSDPCKMFLKGSVST